MWRTWFGAKSSQVPIPPLPVCFTWNTTRLTGLYIKGHVTQVCQHQLSFMLRCAIVGVYSENIDTELMTASQHLTVSISWHSHSLMLWKVMSTYRHLLTNTTGVLYLCVQVVRVWVWVSLVWVSVLTLVWRNSASSSKHWQRVELLTGTEGHWILSVWLSVCVSVCQSVCLSVCLSVFLSGRRELMIVLVYCILSLIYCMIFVFSPALCDTFPTCMAWYSLFVLKVP